MSFKNIFISSLSTSSSNDASISFDLILFISKNLSDFLLKTARLNIPGRAVSSASYTSLFNSNTAYLPHILLILYISYNTLHIFSIIHKYKSLPFFVLSFFTPFTKF